MLNITGLKTHYFTDDGVVRAVEGVDLSVSKGKTVGLVGESGCGKSTIGLSILRLIPSPGKIVSGVINFHDRNLLDLSDEEMRQVRGNEISMIFQDPTASLNPVLSVGDQIGEAIRIHQGIKATNEVNRRSTEILNEVGISDAETRLSNYPHELSGGMQQRVMIAIALSCQPKLLLADEPTSSLDVTIEAQILDLLRNLRKEFELSILMISHDLGVIAEISDKVAVMYAGHKVEDASVVDLFENPQHPYTKALLHSIPKVEEELTEIHPIPGRVPSLIYEGEKCLFSSRCEYSTNTCHNNDPTEQRVEEGHLVACHHANELITSGGPSE